MKKNLRIFLFLLLALVLAAGLTSAGALTVSDLPESVEFNADAPMCSFTMEGAGNTEIQVTTGSVKGRTTLLVFGRTTCWNTNAFLSGITEALPLLEKKGISVLVGLVDDPSDEEVNEFSARYGSVRCGKISNYFDNGMWNNLEAAGVSTNQVTFPVVFLVDYEAKLAYWSTGYVEEPLQVVTGALVLDGDVDPELYYGVSSKPGILLQADRASAALNQEAVFTYEALNTESLNDPYVQWKVYEWKNGVSELVNYAIPWFSFGGGPTLGTSGRETFTVKDPDVEKVTVEALLFETLSSEYVRQVCAESIDIPVETYSGTSGGTGDFTGLTCYPDLGWVLVRGGSVDFSYTGLWCDPEYGWRLVRNGKVDFDYTGLWGDPQVGWWLLSGGEICFDYTGLYCDPQYGWWLIGNGTICFDYTGLWNDPNYGWRLISGGCLADDYTGLWCDPNCGWWLIQNGTIAWNYTGLWNDPNYGWWLIGNGAVCFDYTGLWCDPNCGWWLIGGGTVCFDYNGLWNDPNYGWWLIGGGTVCFDYNGLWNDPNVGWWLISGGTINWGYTGPYDEFGGTWNIVNGQLIF